MKQKVNMTRCSFMYFKVCLLFRWVAVILLLISFSNCRCGKKLKAGRGKHRLKLSHENPPHLNPPSPDGSTQGDPFSTNELGDESEQVKKDEENREQIDQEGDSTSNSATQPMQLNRTQLHDVLAYSMKNNDINAIKTAIASMPKLTTTDKLGRNLVHEAVYGGNKEIVKFLLDELQKKHPHETEAMINQSEESLGKTPFMYAIRNRDIELAKLLIQYGATPSAEDLADGLNFAVKDGRLPLLKFLIEDVIQDQSIPTVRGENLLHLAAKSDWYDIVEYLSQYQQVNVQCLNEQGWSALHYAAAYDNKNSLVALIEKGLDVNAQDKQGKTPLHLAVEKFNRDAVLKLLGNKADPTIQDKDGKTVLNLVEELSKQPNEADPKRELDLKVIKIKLRNYQVN